MKRFLAALFALLLLCAPAWATPTFLVEATCGQNSTSCTTSAINTTGASLIIAYVSDNTSQTISFTDSAGNTWSNLTFNNPGNGCEGNIYYVINPTTSASHTFTGHGYQNGVAVMAFSGTGVLDGSNGNGQFYGGGPIQPGSITPTVNGDLLVTGMGCGGLTSLNSGFSTPYGNANAGSQTSYIAYLVQATAAAINPSWTLSGASTATAHIAAFKAASAPVTPENALMAIP